MGQTTVKINPLKYVHNQVCKECLCDQAFYCHIIKVTENEVGGVSRRHRYVVICEECMDKIYEESCSKKCNRLRLKSVI